MLTLYFCYSLDIIESIRKTVVNTSTKTDTRPTKPSNAFPKNIITINDIINNAKFTIVKIFELFMFKIVVFMSTM